MKKTLTTCMLCSCLAIGSAFAQSNTQKTDVNRISFGLKGGYNDLLLSDRTGYSTEINPSFGAFFEITANPLWGAGIEYLYMNNNQDAKVGDNLKSAMHGITYYNSINITNLVAKYRSPCWQKFNVYSNLGGGVGFYKYEFENSNDSKSGAQPFFMAGLSMEYNLAKWFALGLESQYRYNLDVKFMPEYTGTANLCGLNITARFKLGGDKNVRNIALADYKPCAQTVASAPDHSAALNQQKQQINQLENKVSNQNEEIQTLQSQVKELQNSLN
jgi:hypothetical protein